MFKGSASGRGLAVAHPDADMSGKILFLEQFDLQGDGYLFTHCNPTGFKCSVPDQAEVLTIDLGAGRGAPTDIAPRVLALF